MPPKLIRLIRVFIRDMNSDVFDRSKVSVAQFRVETGRRKNLGEWWTEAGQLKLDQEEAEEKLERERK